MIPPEHAIFAVPKKGRLYDRCMKLLEGAGLHHRRVSPVHSSVQCPLLSRWGGLLDEIVNAERGTMAPSIGAELLISRVRGYRFARFTSPIGLAGCSIFSTFMSTVLCGSSLRSLGSPTQSGGHGVTRGSWAEEVGLIEGWLRRGSHSCASRSLNPNRWRLRFHAPRAGRGTWLTVSGEFGSLRIRFSIGLMEMKADPTRNGAEREGERRGDTQSLWLS